MNRLARLRRRLDPTAKSREALDRAPAVPDPQPVADYLADMLAVLEGIEHVLTELRDERAKDRAS